MVPVRKEQTTIKSKMEAMQNANVVVVGFCFLTTLRWKMAKPQKKLVKLTSNIYLHPHCCYTLHTVTHHTHNTKHTTEATYISSGKKQ